MKNEQIHSPGVITESIRGIVDRVTYHNPDNGWSVLRVFSFDNPHQQETVTVHQTKVFAGATMEFHGSWTTHPKFGRQFKATKAIEKKPATIAALEKYLGSGLIKGIGPKTAHKIVKHFGNETLEIFENDIKRLTEIRGIAQLKLNMICDAWIEHRAIRKVMMFLQSHGISTLFAVRIYKEYGDNAIEYVNDDPYRLAQDFYGIGFFSADRVALSIGLEKDSPQRIKAGINHVLAASRESGHCYLTQSQITAQVNELLELKLDDRIPDYLDQMKKDQLLMVRELINPQGMAESCYYSKSLYYDEMYVANRISDTENPPVADKERIEIWISRYCKAKNFSLSIEQADAVKGIVCEMFSVLTGGPGCGKTTTTMIIVKLLEAMKCKILLAAPTGRAAQRMMDVIGNESKTIHRLLEWQMGRFKRNEENPLDADFVIVDECSMLDISLTASLLKAIPQQSRILFIGDADQLPSVGAGNVLRDIIASGAVPCFELKKVFRQAQESSIIRYAHQINNGEIPHIDSPFKKPEIWEQKTDCLFMDSDEATKEQTNFVARVKRFHEYQPLRQYNTTETEPNPYEFRINETVAPYETELTIPKKFQHVNLEEVFKAEGRVDELLSVLNKVHPWSSLHYGLSAFDVVRRLYLEWIPKYFGEKTEIQILSPMTRGSLGTVSLNRMIQESANPARKGRGELSIGERILRVGDRVIHSRNNYDLNVFNGDIGIIQQIDTEELTLSVSFFPDGRVVEYTRDAITELALAYAITIHKSQGSEFEAVIIPVLTQHFKMLFRNLIYTGLTRAKKLAVLVGTRKALAMSVRNQDTSQRQTLLKELLQ
ncbi:SF1B family DNA helicase RecD2 [Desulfobacterium sp. N47]